MMQIQMHMHGYTQAHMALPAPLLNPAFKVTTQHIVRRQPFLGVARKEISYSPVICTWDICGYKVGGGVVGPDHCAIALQ